MLEQPPPGRQPEQEESESEREKEGARGGGGGEGQEGDGRRTLVSGCTLRSRLARSQRDQS